MINIVVLRVENLLGSLCPLRTGRRRQLLPGMLTGTVTCRGRWEETKGLRGDLQTKDTNPDQLTARDL